MELNLAPGWIMIVILSGICASFFKLILGDKVRLVLICWIISAVGFIIGQIVAEQIAGATGFIIAQIGDVYWPQGCIGAFLFLIIFGRKRIL